MKEFFKNFGDKFEVNGVKWKDCGPRDKMLIVSSILGVLSLFILALAEIFKLVTSEVLFLRLCGGLGIVLFVWTVKSAIKIEYKK